jgi:hypothetical protein
MLVRILCPGPSLSVTWPRQGVGSIGPIIGVNRAINYTACDWAIVGDACTFPRLRALPLRGLVSFNDVLREKLPPNWQRLERRIWEDLPQPPWGMVEWGLEAALLLAQHLGGTDVALYGVDWSGFYDYDGVKGIDDRSKERWNDREKPAVTKLIDHLTTAHRIRTTRILP